MEKVQNKQTKKIFNIYKGDIYNEFYIDNKKTLQEELCNTIERVSNEDGVLQSATFEFKVSEGVQVDEKEFKDAYKNSFNTIKAVKKNECFRCLMYGLSLFLVGMILLFINIYVVDTNNFVYEFFNVFTWVFLWGAIEVLLIEMVQIIIEIKKLKKILEAKIVIKK